MAVRLRPQSAAWMAPHALAAQLNAQTGQIAGQGVAGLLGGIAQGVGAYTQKREQRRVEGINEQRYQDSLMRRDREFQYGAAKDQAALLEDYLKGAEAEIALSAVVSPTGTPDPSKVQAYRTAQSSAQALRAQLAKIGGVSTPNIPPMPEPPPRPEGSFTPERREEYRKQVGYESLSDDELTTVAASLAADAESMRAELDAIAKIGGVESAVAAAQKRTAYANKSREAMIAEATLKRRQAKAESAQKVTEAEAVARAREGVQAEFKGKEDAASKARDAEAVAALRADLEKRGIKETLPDDLATARKVYNDAVVSDPNSVAAAARKAEAAKTRSENQIRLEASKQTGRERMAAIHNKQKDKALAAKAAQDAIRNHEFTVKTALDEYEILKKMAEKGLVAEDDPDLRAAYGKYAEARSEHAGMLESMPSPAAMGSPASGDSMSQAEAEYNALPDDQKTPEAAAKIAAKYGIR